MSFRDVLVLLDGEADSNERLAFAGRLARRHNAHLIGACIIDALVPPYVSPMLGLYGGGLLGQEICSAAEERAISETERVEAQFQDVLRREALAGEWHSLSGSDGQNLVRLARTSDLAVLGQLRPEQEYGRPGWVLIENMLLRSGRPVLMAPYIGTPEKFGESVLIAWDGSQHATRAVHDALPLLRRAASVTLLGVDPPDVAESSLAATDMATHLARHGVRVTTAETVSAGLSISDALLGWAADCGADCIIAGGYGHSRLRELVLGGVTRGLLQHMTVPVLLSH